MAPVWAMVFVTAVVVVVSIKSAGHAYLTRVTAGSRNSCVAAQVFLEAGQIKMKEVLRHTGIARIEGGKLDQTALGLLSGDELVAAAISDFTRSIELCPEFQDAHLQLHILEYLAGNAARAHYELGLFRRGQKELVEAMMEFELALEADAQFGPALLQMADVYREMGESRRALELVEANMEVMASAPGGDVIVGAVLAANGQHERALEYLRRAVTRAPYITENVTPLYFTYVALGRPGEGAEFLYQQAVDSQVVAPAIFDYAAALYRAADDSDGETRSLRRAVAIFPNSVDLNWRLAEALYRQGNFAEASDFANRAVEIDLNYVMKRVEFSGIDPRRGS